MPNPPAAQQSIDASLRFVEAIDSISLDDSPDAKLQVEPKELVQPVVSIRLEHRSGLTTSPAVLEELSHLDGVPGTRVIEPASLAAGQSHGVGKGAEEQFAKLHVTKP